MKAVVQVFLGEVLSKGMLAATILLLIRYLPAPEMARFTLAWSIVGVVASIASSAFNRVYIVGAAELGERGTDETFLAGILWSCAALGVLLLPLWSSLEHLYGAVVAVVVATCLSDFAKTFYQRQLAFMRLTVVELLRTTLLLAGVALLIFKYPEELTALDVLLVQAGTMLVLFAGVFAGRLRWREVAAGRGVLQLVASIFLKQYRWVTGYFILVALLSNLTIFLVKVLGSEHELAAMGTAMRYFGLLALALGAVHIVLLPSIQKAQTSAELEHLLLQHHRLVLPFVAAVLLGAYLAGSVMPWIDGGKYPEAIPAFRVLAVTAIVSFLFSPHINILLKAGDFRFIFWLMVVGTLATAVGSALLIEYWRLTGGALGFLLGTGGINVIVYARARQFRLGLKSAAVAAPTAAGP